MGALMIEAKPCNPSLLGVAKQSNEEEGPVFEKGNCGAVWRRDWRDESFSVGSRHGCEGPVLVAQSIPVHSEHLLPPIPFTLLTTPSFYHLFMLVEKEL